MWQAQFLIAMERERELGLALERRRLLSDAVRRPAPGGGRFLATVRAALSLLRAVASRASAAAAAAASALDRPVVGSHHL